MTDRVNAALYARNVLSGDDLVVAVAIAYAESSCIPDAYNPETTFFAARGYANPADTGEGSTGLWQIFSFEHPEFATWDLKDPAVNACAMAMIWFRAGKSFNPWSTFRIEPAAYLKHLDQARADITALASA